MESYVNSSILLQRAASQFKQLLREPSPQSKGDSSRAESSDHKGEDVVNAEIRLGDAKVALLLGQMRYHMQDFDAANILFQHALADVRSCHAQWTREAEALEKRLQNLRDNAGSGSTPRKHSTTVTAVRRSIGRLAHKRHAVCRVALVAILSYVDVAYYIDARRRQLFASLFVANGILCVRRSLAATCDAVKRHDTSAQLLQRCADEVQHLLDHLRSSDAGDELLWGAITVRHHKHISKPRSLGPKNLEFYLPSLWLSWTSSPFPSLPPVATVQSPSVFPMMTLEGSRCVNTAALEVELLASKAGLLTRAALAHKLFHNREGTRTCCAKVHALYMQHLHVDFAHHQVGDCHFTTATLQL